MKQSVITLILALGAVTGWAQNVELENFFNKYKNHPLVEYEDQIETAVKNGETSMETCKLNVTETIQIEDSEEFIKSVAKEYENIQGYKKFKATKLLKLKGNVFMKMFFNKSCSIHVWESSTGYKDVVMEFNGCAYVLIHLGGHFELDEINKYMQLNSLE